MKFPSIFKTAIVIGAITLVSFMAPDQQKKQGAAWQISNEYKNKRNPFASDASLVNVGKNSYGKNCRSCHGRAGLGDGPMAAQLETFPGDFSKAAWQDKYKDGEIYYMSIIGRDEMPNFEKTITDEEERWALVNFIRTLKK